MRRAAIFAIDACVTQQTVYLISVAAPRLVRFAGIAVAGVTLALALLATGAVISAQDKYTCRMGSVILFTTCGD
jgi:hypothetical protein